MTSAFRGTNELQYSNSIDAQEQYSLLIERTNNCKGTISNGNIIITPTGDTGSIDISFIFYNTKKIIKNITFSTAEKGEQGIRGPQGESVEQTISWVGDYGIDGESGKFKTIKADEIYTKGNYSVGYLDGSKILHITGHMGYAEGSGVELVNGKPTTKTTYGVALSSGSNIIDNDTTTPYIIVTDKGARMSAYGASLLVSNGKAMFRQAGGDWQEIGSNVAVFG